jgi:hypothetical protein
MSRSGSFGVLAGRADACPARVGSDAASIRLCFGIDLGAIRAEGIVVPRPRTGIDFWSDAVAVLRARWAPDGWPLFVELEGGGAAAFTRPEFDYEIPGAPGQPSGARLVDQPLAGAAIGSFAAGWRLW